METTDVSANTKPSNAMLTGKYNTPVKATEPAILFKASCNARRTHTPFTTADSKTSLHFVWKNQGSTLRTSEAEEKVMDGSDLISLRKCNGSSENVEFVGDCFEEKNGICSGSRNDITTQSGREDSSRENDDEAHQNKISEMKKRRLNEMVGDAAHNALNNSISHCYNANNQARGLEDFVQSRRTSEEDKGISFHSYFAGSKPMIKRVNSSDVSHPVALAPMGGCEEVINEQKVQESSDCLQTEAELRKETSMLCYNLMRRAKGCRKLRRENESLMDELKQMCSPEIMSILQAKNPDQGFISESSSESDSSLDLDMEFQSDSD